MAGVEKLAFVDRLFPEINALYKKARQIEHIEEDAHTGLTLVIKKTFLVVEPRAQIEFITREAELYQVNDIVLET